MTAEERDHVCYLKGIPKYRAEAVKYWAGLSRRLILYKVLYWLLHLHMGQLIEQEGRSSSAVKSVIEDFHHPSRGQQHWMGRDTHTGPEFIHTKRAIGFHGPGTSVEVRTL